MMKQITHIKFFFAVLFLATVGVYAQNCYETGMNESRAMFNEAQRLQSLGNEEEAAQMFLAAFQKAQDTEANCKDKPKPPKLDRKGRLIIPYYVALSTGASGFGTVSFGDMDKRSAIVFGADIAYFFNTWLGAGVKMNMANCNVDFNDMGTYHDKITFFGPCAYTRWAKERIEFVAGASVGLLKWNLSDVEVKNITGSNQSATTTGAFLWTGVNYMLTKKIGAAINVQSALGTVKTNEGLERNPAGASATIVLNYRF